MPSPIPSPALTAPAAETPPAFTAQELRNALGQFATGITIITCCSEQGTPVGLTANSFNSVSMAPPLVLWSLGLQAGSLSVFQKASHYAIHVLHAQQREWAERFATRGIDRFAGVAWRPGLGGAPLLDGVATVLECRQHHQHVEGDHLLFIGHVERCVSNPGNSPLLFHGGRFHAPDLTPQTLGAG